MTRGDYSSGTIAIYPVTETLAIRQFIRSNENEM